MKLLTQYPPRNGQNELNVEWTGELDGERVARGSCRRRWSNPSRGVSGSGRCASRGSDSRPAAGLCPTMHYRAAIADATAPSATAPWASHPLSRALSAERYTPSSDSPI